jgi:GxxExxY protein
MESNEKPALLLKEITGIAIGAFFGTYNELAGFPEFVVCRGTAIALRDAGLIVREEVSLPVWFRGRQIVNFKADLVVDPGLIIEVKATPEIQPFHKTQLKNYLKATGLEVGLLLNFGRRPEFSRVVYESIRKRPPAEIPEDLEQILDDTDGFDDSVDS